LIQKKKKRALFWVKRGESARCRNGDLITCINANQGRRVTGFKKKFDNSKSLYFFPAIRQRSQPSVN
jgi:hypothetical protein